MSTDRIKYKEEARIFCTQRMPQVEQFLSMQLQNGLRFMSYASMLCISGCCRIYKNLKARFS